MFNFNELAIVQPNEPNCYRGSFVGIRQDKYLEKMAFTVPKGFENFEVNYENVKNLFFSMYRTFDKFLENAKKNENLDDKPTGKDNTQIDSHNGTYTFTDEDNNDIILYSKIDLIDSIFQLYKEMEIESLIQELGLIEDIDYSKIDRYLDKGIYLDNHAIFIENMVGYRNIVRGVPSELIEIFCYIYHELANELKQEVSESIKEISFNFSYKFLSPEQSLFSEYSFEWTMNTLKDCLDNIHKTTAYKNGQYWDIYEAVEHFLYGSLEFDSQSNQGFWGIDNFSYIWEEMCNYYVYKSRDRKILYCDTVLPLNDKRNYLTKEKLSKHQTIWIDKSKLKNNFYIELNKRFRYLRPDIIFEWELLNIIKSDFKKLVLIDKEEIKFGILSNGKYEVSISPSNGLKDENSIFSEMILDLLYKFFEHSQFNGKKKQYDMIPAKKTKGFRLKDIPINKFNEMIDNFESLKGFKDGETIFLIDWKYYNFSIFENQSYKRKPWVCEAITKQLAYEFCLSQNIPDKKINNQFCVPYYAIDCNDISVDKNVELDSGIEIVKINFLKIQEIYLND